MRNHQSHRHAFSLVELSIVLVILGLLVGGVLAGQSLIRAAELRSVSTDIKRYQTTLYSFRDKYFALPGDMTNATSFWGDQASGTGACVSAATPDGTPGTCNGDGNGQILDGGGEMFRAWQHLSMAGLIEGSFTGIIDTIGGNHHTFGLNAPGSKIPNAGFGISYIGNFVGDAGTYAITYGNIIWFGATGTTSTGGRPQREIFKPEEAWNIDTKMDDGKPAQGRVISRTLSTNTWGNADSCTTSTSFSDYAGDYNLDSSVVTCSFMIKAD